jgi:hypothetical protein
MLTAITVLLITSLAGGVFGSVAAYTYIDSSKGKYCDKMSSDVMSEEEELYYYEEHQNSEPQYDENSYEDEYYEEDSYLGEEEY